MAEIWLNGTLLPAESAGISPADRGLLLGDGLFETIAVRQGQARDVDRHFARLTTGAKLLRLTVPFDAAGVEVILNKVIAANGLGEGGLRLTLTRGAGARGVLPSPCLVPTVLITSFPPPLLSGALSVIVAQSVRRDETSPLSAVKSLNYLPSILARIEADERGAGDAILLNHAGRVAEASAGNVFFKLGGEWLTPPVAEGALPGIRRARLLESGRVREAALSLGDLRAAKGLCIGSVLALRPVTIVEGMDIATDENEIAALAEF
jgi:branched-chain amino acid aminotransferase